MLRAPARAAAAGVLVAAALVGAAPATAVAPPAASAAAERGDSCPDAGWTDVNGEGIPRPMARPGWGRCPSRPGALWWARWSYPRFPLPCVPADSDLPAYRLIWVSDAAADRTPLVDDDPRQVGRAVRRAVSVVAASWNGAVTDQADLMRSTAPRLVTVRDGTGRCQPRFDRVTVPHAVLLREPYQNWTNPSTGAAEPGLWPWLEHHGYPASPDRRYITVTDSPAVWNFLGGAAIVPCDGSGYGATDDRPGAQNCNQAGGTWMTVSTDNSRDDFTARSSGSFGERLAHELAHGMGALVDSAPHHNPGNPGHPSDCADLLCYNDISAPGQHYDRCGGALADTWDAFVDSGANVSRPAYRLDCGRDDYYGYALTGDTVTERAWTATRWAGEDDRFYWGGQDGYDGPVFSNDDHPIPPECTYDPDGWCPPGVTPASTARRAPSTLPVVVR